MTFDCRHLPLLSHTTTLDLAKKIAPSLKCGDVVAIKGDLGVGKTLFCSGIINFFYPDLIAGSPTFNLLNSYESSSDSNAVIHHYDLYRLKNMAEIYNLGIEDSFTRAISLIEWPEIIESILPPDIIKITITLNDNLRYVDVEDCRIS
jgi:tRNA threonylcarbamoyl adenosine modification protein YjeE